MVTRASSKFSSFFKLMAIAARVSSRSAMVTPVSGHFQAHGHGYFVRFGYGRLSFRVSFSWRSTLRTVTTRTQPWADRSWAV
ncbi:hypothetical protein NL676_008022 [Syzygium grande]|nr:hypothetical protein NL676_008022 [Syzygium grande]